MIGLSDSLAFAPSLPPWLFTMLTGAVALVILIGFSRLPRGFTGRALALGMLLLAVANPRIVDEDKRFLEDIVVVVVDESPSQDIGERQTQTEKALADLQDRLGGRRNLEVRVERAGRGEGFTEETRLFEAITRATADVPRGRLAGVILITDGQIHDVPADLSELALDAPLHALLTGKPDEADRRLVVEKVQTYGLVGRKARAVLRVDDASAGEGQRAVLTMRRNGSDPETLTPLIGQPFPLEIPIEHGGANVVEFSLEPGPQELTLANNRAVVAINGVRDRLRVLLVSGRPYVGERTWRNLLKSDPSVDLVHFTILRPPDKQDSVPLNEMALIAFPMKELFEDKLNDFDLMVFDSYSRSGLMPMQYLENIANFVRGGGAVLFSVGPEYGDIFTLYNSPLREILPASPTTALYENAFRPKLTPEGRRHPVTGGLKGAGGPGEKPKWGSWVRHVGGRVTSGATLMTGIGDRPLLLLDRKGEGRVALLLSDTIWLWAKGYEGGGPQAEFLRRLAHWLMKEPELEEERLTAEVREGALTVTRRSLKPVDGPVTLTLPSGEEKSLTLTEEDGGPAAATIPITEPGLYKAAHGDLTALAIAGRLNPPETAAVAATAKRLEPLTRESGGGLFWLAEGGVPDVRLVKPGGTTTGRGWLGLSAKEDYVVTGLAEVPLLPPAMALVLVLGTLLAAWWKEGR